MSIIIFLLPKDSYLKIGLEYSSVTQPDLLLQFKHAEYIEFIGSGDGIKGCPNWSKNGRETKEFLQKLFAIGTSSQMHLERISDASTGQSQILRLPYLSYSQYCIIWDKDYGVYVIIYSLVQILFV